MERLQHEESPEIEDAAMSAGFGDEVTTEQPALEPEQQQPDEQEQVEVQAQEEEQPAQEEERPLTRAELKAIEERAAALEAQLSKVHDKAFGKIGELQQRIEAVRAKTIGLSPKAKERLSEEFPELAEMLFDGGEDATQAEPEQQAKQPTGPNAEELMERLRSEREVEKREIEKRLLRRDHPDWETVVSGNSFRSWVATLPPSEQQELANSWDADFISQKLTAYKEAERARAEQTATTTKKSNKRLENAVTPRGVSRNAPGHDLDDEEAAMRQAFGG